MVYDETHGLMDSPRRPEQVRLMPHAAEFLRGVKALGYLAIVVTNQPGLAKGTLSERELRSVHARLAKLLKAGGAAWDDLRYCPHHPTGAPGLPAIVPTSRRVGTTAGGLRNYIGPCDCRKPKPGLLLRAAEDFAVDLRASWMVGDGLIDVQAGRRAGCRSILFTTLKVRQAERFFELEKGCPDYIAPDLNAALAIIRKNAP
ncbi:MAG: HAD-IIIA family hydrolase [Lentisphaerae bacterium]|nr:HAD-IIIA family hydrolase [Lentisphaerota bacterium]